MEKKEILKKINQVFCNVFDDDNLIITFDTCSDDIEDWDSLSHITLVAGIESAFGMQFDLKQVASLNNVGEMVDLIVAMTSN